MEKYLTIVLTLVAVAACQNTTTTTSTTQASTTQSSATQSPTTLTTSTPSPTTPTPPGVHWDDLRLTFDPVNGFNQVPRLEREAILQGWVQLPSLNCFNQGLVSGIRYRRPGDNSAVLLYDVTGVIAGIQMFTPQSDILSRNNTFRFGSIQAFQNESLDGEHYFVLTTYFVNPAIICTTGRGQDDLEFTGTGHGVYLQTGPNPYSYLQIPSNRATALRYGFSDNNCLAGMGDHSWYRMEDYAATNCNEHIPIFGLFNTQGQLHGFGYSIVGTAVNPRFENPPRPVVQLIAGTPAPLCLLDATDNFGLTTMHVYFISTASSITC